MILVHNKNDQAERHSSQRGPVYAVASARGHLNPGGTGQVLRHLEPRSEVPLLPPRARLQRVTNRRHRFSLGHATVSPPPRLRQTLHPVGWLPLLLARLVLPSAPLVGAVVVQTGQYGGVKHLLEVLLGQRGALHVGHGADVHRTAPGGRRVHGLLPVLIQVDENLKAANSVILNGKQFIWNILYR